MAIDVGTNSWVTLAEAETYFSDHIGSTPWDALTDSNKSKYLITAYRWIYYDSAFPVPASSSETAVKNAQCEAALFLINYYTGHNKREALIAGGVKEFEYGKRREDLTSVKKPQTVIDMLSSVGYYASGVALFEVTNDETDV